MNYFESKRLREQRGELAAKQAAMIDQWKANESGEATAEQHAEFDSIDAEIRSLEAKIETAERIELVEERSKPVEKASGSYVPRISSAPLDRRAMNDAIRGQILMESNHSKDVTQEMRNAMTRCGLTDRNTIELRTYDGLQSNATPGSYLLQEQLVQGVQNAIKASGGLISQITIKPTADGNTLTAVVADNTSRVATIRPETGESTFQNNTYARKSLKYFPYQDGALLTIEQLRDSVYDVLGDTIDQMGQAVRRGLNNHIVNGAGTTEPWGLLNRTYLGHTTDTYNDMTADDLYELEDAIDLNVLNGGNCKYGFGRSALKRIKMMKDSLGRPMWQPSLIVGQPSLVNGYEYFLDTYYPAFGGAGRKVATFGDHSYYWLRQLNDGSLTVLDQLFRVQFGAYGYLYEQSFDGDLMVAPSFHPIVHLLTGSSAS